ncbi:MAG: FAD-dependent oxidoreductase [Actinobacteria bacterium]|nr:FAD-dependent oxidoreductase [Actinomycetota bacterium]
MHTDVVVVGSGGAGLAAALTAAKAGAKVVLLERASVFGGTTAWSGAFMWIPNNSLMKAAGIEDSREEALAYVKRLAMGRVSDELLEAYVDQAPKMVDWMTSEGMSWAVLSHFPDYHPEFPGGKTGRSLEPRLFDTNLLGEYKDLLRSSPSSDLAVEYSEIEEWGGTSNLSGWDFALLGQRMQQGLTGWGRAGIGHMMHLCLQAGVTFVNDTRALRLMRDGTRISGVYAERDGRKEQYEARLGVILACAGFEWNPTLVHRFLGVPMDAPGSPPHNTGDGLLMCMEVGANLANMTEHVGTVGMAIPGEVIEGYPLVRLLNTQRTSPGSIMVNRAGKRFVNESQNYNDMTKTMGTFEPVAYDYPNKLSYLVFDKKFRDTYIIGTLMPGDPTPPWLTEASSIAELAGKIGVDADGLQDQIAQFNQGAAEGKDPVFHRGESAYDLYYGDKNNKPNPALRPIDQPPYYGLEAKFASLGTKGGPLTDTVGRVLDVHDEPIPGLYAAGNVAANVFGPGYPGAGATCGPAWTFGWLAGQHIASR